MNDDIARRLARLEKEVHVLRGLVWAGARVLFPAVLLALLLVYVALIHPDPGRIYGLMVLFTFTPAGKFTASIGIGQGLSVWEAIVIFGGIDLIVGMLLVWNMPLLHRIPRMGRFLKRMEIKGQEALAERPFIRRTAFMGLALWVAVPFQGTGAVAGAIVGRVMGMGEARTISAIALGGFGGVALIATGSRGILNLFATHPELAIGLAILVIGGGVIAWRLGQRTSSDAPE